MPGTVELPFPGHSGLCIEYQISQKCMVRSCLKMTPNQNIQKKKKKKKKHRTKSSASVELNRYFQNGKTLRQAIIQHYKFTK